MDHDWESGASYLDANYEEFKRGEDDRCSLDDVN
jgi:hypothetical protein